MAIEISYDGDTFTYPNLSLTAELPFGFEGSDAKRGRTAEMLKISGLLLKADAETLIDLYRAWRDDKILEEDPQKTGVIGAVVLVSGEDIGFNWTEKPCWFVNAPELSYAGIYAKVLITVVDAQQALEILIQEEEDSEETGIDYGTLEINGATITLTSYPETYEGLPKLARNPVGVHVISGSLSLDEVKEVEGWVSATDLELLTAWLNSTVAATPDPDTWFPVNWSKPTGKNRTISGTVTLTYDVNFELIKVKG
jgi:hypothetical protein